jgi:hypothetical protein
MEVFIHPELQIMLIHLAQLKETNLFVTVSVIDYEACSLLLCGAT